MRNRKKFAVALAATATLAACTRERVIVVREPSSTQGGGEGGYEGEPTTPIATAPGGTSPWGILDRARATEYGEVVRRVEGMASDGDVASRARQRGLSVVNLTWEDTGRYHGSSVGPNISDLTLQVRHRDPSGAFASALMPVIRFPNFSDRTGDIPADKFFVRVGNERGSALRSVALTEVLRNIRSYVTVPASILGSGDLSASRDSHYLVSAQAVFLPIPKEGKAEFNPVLFNYQSSPGSPAVLSLLVTREGTSVSVVENRGEDASSVTGSGQEIYFNDKGQRSAFTAERRTDVAARIEAHGGPKTEAERSMLQRGADTLFLVQVPLRHRMRRHYARDLEGGAGDAIAPPMSASKGAAAAPMKKSAPMADSRERSDVENAVLGHGPHLGPVKEGGYLTLERDPSFPVRVTVQFYKATSNGVVSDADLDAIARSIGSVYEHADFVGSLVVPEGDPRRPTAWQSVPPTWWTW